MNSCSTFQDRERPYGRCEAASKLIVICSILAALALQAVFDTRQPAGRGLMSTIVFFAMLVWGRYKPQQACTVLLLTFVSKAIVVAVTDRNEFYTPFYSLIAGLSLSSPQIRAWRFPDDWKLPLVLVGLIVSLSWPVVFLRELDFVPSLTSGSALLNNSDGMLANEAAGWALNAVLIQGLGLLWLDWLFGVFHRVEPKMFEEHVLRPLAISFVLCSIIALLQGFYDIAFLNIDHWSDRGRAGGGVVDANAFGILSALFGGCAAVVIWKSAGTRKTLAAVGVLIYSWICLVLSGSRTALMIAGVSSLYFLWTIARLAPRSSRRALVPVCSVFLLALLSLLGHVDSRDVNTPFNRIQNLAKNAPSPSLGGLISHQAYDRILYGKVSLQMLNDYPSGIGVGSLNTLIPDHAKKYGISPSLRSDNALNWYLHQLVEFGWIASISWILWILIFVRFLIRSRPEPSVKLQARFLKVLIVTFGFSSLVGVHTANPEILFTFWTLVFWLITHVKGKPVEPKPLSVYLYLIAFLIAGIHTIALINLSLGKLRVTHRAALLDRDYSYGFYAPERDTDANTFRWTAQKAVAVLPIDGPWLRFRMWVHHPDAANHPVGVSVRINDAIAFRRLLKNSDPIDVYAPTPQNDSRVVVTIRVSRTWRPSEFQGADTRNLGVGVANFIFVPTPLRIIKEHE